MNQSRRITEGAVVIALFSILTAMTIYIPVLGILSVWMLPLPIILYTLRFGRKAGGMVLAVSFIVSVLIASTLAIPLVLLFGVGGFVVGASFHKKNSAFKTLFAGSLSYIFTILLLFVGSVVILDIHPFMAIEEAMEQSIDSAEELLTSMGQEPNEQLDIYREFIGQITDIAPMIIVGAGVGYAFITQGISHLFLRRLEHEGYRFPPIREWTMPKSFLWYYLAGIILWLIALDEQGTALHTVTMNVVPLLELAMFIQGVSVMFHFVHVKNMSRALPVLMIIASFFIVFIVPMFIRLLGILDLGFDLKSRIKSEKK